MSKKSPKKLDETEYAQSTRLIHGKSQTDAWDYSHHVVPPISRSATFRLDSASRGALGFEAFARLYPDDPGHSPVFIYDRLGEPNNLMLQQALAIAEDKEIAVTFSTGMAAVSAAVMFALEAGEEIISHKTVYGCTYSLFKNWMPRCGYKVHFSDLKQPDSFLEFVNDNTRILYLESPANPTLDLLDLEAIVKLVSEVNEKRPENKKIYTVIDNTFATPFCQRPARFGIDIIVHSLTKGIGGFGTSMGGAVVTDKRFRDQLMMFRKDFGATLSPDSAWQTLVYGMSTLPIRMRKSQENAFEVSRYLESHKEVEQVFYPGLESFPQYEIAQRMMRDYDGNFAPGIVVYFELKGRDLEHQRSRGEMMMNFIADNAYAVTLAVSLGQTRTLIEHPSSMTHSAYSVEEQIDAGMNPGGIRLALGLEHAGDIIKDLDRALEFVTS